MKKEFLQEQYSKCPVLTGVIFKIISKWVAGMLWKLSSVLCQSTEKKSESASSTLTKELHPTPARGSIPETVHSAVTVPKPLSPKIPKYFESGDAITTRRVLQGMGVTLHECPKASTFLSTVSAALIKHLVLPTPCLLSHLDIIHPVFLKPCKVVIFFLWVTNHWHVLILSGYITVKKFFAWNTFLQG